MEQQNNQAQVYKQILHFDIPKVLMRLYKSFGFIVRGLVAECAWKLVHVW